jgi:hypothetical protein
MDGKRPRATTAGTRSKCLDALPPIAAMSHTLSLTDRDRHLLRDVWCYRYLTSTQVARLRFSHPKVAQRRLRQLTAAGFLLRFHPTEATKAGFQTWWYALTRPGAREVSTTGLPLAAVLPPTRQPRTLGFLAHHTQTTDFRLWLHEACEPTSGFSYSYLPSYDETTVNGRRSRRAALPLPGSPGSLVPDGVFTLTHRDRSALFLLEVDRGTEPLTGRHPNAIERKLQAYRTAYDTHAEDHLANLFRADLTGFRILCLVPDAARQARFLELAHRLDLAPLVWVTTTSLTQERGKLDAKAWAVTSTTDLHALTE